MISSEDNSDNRLEVPWPQKGDMLVTDSNDDGFLVQTVFGTPWVPYVFAYRNAAEVLVERVQKEKISGNFLVFPIVFLYRHYLELRLKALIWDGDDMDNQPDRRLDNEHGLMNLWKQLRPIIEKWFPDSPQLELDAVEGVLKQFEKLDSKSQAARYPTDKAGNPSNLLDIKINLKKFADTVTRTANFLDCHADAFAELKRSRFF